MPAGDSTSLDLILYLGPLQTNVFSSIPWFNRKLGACTEGVGGSEFGCMARTRASGSGFMNEIASAAVEIDQWQLEKLGLVTAKLDVLYHLAGLPVESPLHRPDTAPASIC